MHVRGLSDGGRLILFVGPEHAGLAGVPPMPAESEPETADETTEW
jgi:hypothetical protein